MEMKVFKKPDAEDKDIYLHLIQEGGGITLQAVNAITGNPISGGCILTITAEGKLHRIPLISPCVGLSLDGDYRINLVD